MGIFSRGKRTPDQQPDPAATTPPVDEAPVMSAEDAAAVAAVSISVSSFQGLGSNTPTAAAVPAAPAPQTRSMPSATAPAQTQVIPGLDDNVLLVEALAALPEKPEAGDIASIARQILQGQVFLRVRGDARALLAEGKDVPLSVGTVGDKKFLLVYSGGAGLQAAVRADGDESTSALGQPVMSMLKRVIDGDYEGIIIDNASGKARIVLPRQILAKAFSDADPQLRVKRLLAGPRTEQTAAEIGLILPEVPLWVAVRRSGEVTGVAEARTTDGTRWLEVYTHPLEVIATGRGDQPAPLKAEQIAGALQRDTGIDGILIDPRGPWIQVTREQLSHIEPAPPAAPAASAD